MALCPSAQRWGAPPGVPHPGRGRGQSSWGVERSISICARARGSVGSERSAAGLGQTDRTGGRSDWYSRRPPLRGDRRPIPRGSAGDRRPPRRRWRSLTSTSRCAWRSESETAGPRGPWRHQTPPPEGPSPRQHRTKARVSGPPASPAAPEAHCRQRVARGLSAAASCGAPASMSGLSVPCSATPA